MRTFDLNQIAELRDAFPEFTRAQFETGILFAMGLSKKEIAWVRSVTYQAVKKMLEEIMFKMKLQSLNHLFTLFQVRIVLYAIKGCIVQNK
ncbi:transcriptional regulator [Sodalis sp. TME1]|nr:transcriptional regulator [Sodalis sp. TME1]